MRVRTVVLLAVLAVACLCGSAAATEYFVATDGDNANPGTIDYPWATIQYAATQVNSGDSTTLP
jgi:hypothetical protein